MVWYKNKDDFFWFVPRVSCRYQPFEISQMEIFTQGAEEGEAHCINSDAYGT